MHSVFMYIISSLLYLTSMCGLFYSHVGVGVEGQQGCVRYRKATRLFVEWGAGIFVIYVLRLSLETCPQDKSEKGRRRRGPPASPPLVAPLVLETKNQRTSINDKKRRILTLKYLKISLGVIFLVLVNLVFLDYLSEGETSKA